MKPLRRLPRFRLRGCRPGWIRSEIRAEIDLPPGVLGSLGGVGLPAVAVAGTLVAVDGAAGDAAVGGAALRGLALPSDIAAIAKDFDLRDGQVR